MAKKFVITEATSGAEVSDSFEADDELSALREIMEQRGEKLVEVPEDVDDEKVEITITVQGGVIGDVDIPQHLDNVVVVVKDYDTEGTDENLLSHDENGDYIESEWEYHG